jgi:hypothetical protein
MTKRHMKKINVMAIISALLISSLMAITVFAFMDTNTVAWEDVPPQVQATIQQNADGGTIDGVDREDKGNQILYGAIVTRPTHERFQMQVAFDGALIELKPAGNEATNLNAIAPAAGGYDLCARSASTAQNYSLCHDRMLKLQRMLNAEDQRSQQTPPTGYSYGR